MKHIDNLLRCCGIYNMPYPKGTATGKELLESRGLSEKEQSFLLNKMIVEVDQLRREIGLNRIEYKKGQFKDVFDWYYKKFNV